jgi:hypothetical protein
MSAPADEGHDVGDADAAVRAAAMNGRDVQLVLPHKSPHGRAQRISAGAVFFRVGVGIGHGGYP